jgi:3-phosphoshikimate 1-carboxyvinyltransferase
VSREPVDVWVPGDKSITHRALIFAALASGESALTGLLDAADTRATAAALRALGVPIPASLHGSVRVAGRGVAGLAKPAISLDCHNSGTTARLLLGALAGCPFETEITGDSSLRGRPMRRVLDPLTHAGAAFRELAAEGHLPIRVRGARPLQPIAWRSPHASAQVKSALLLAGLTGGATVRVSEPVCSRDHTERMLTAMGAPVVGRDEAGGHVVTLDPPARLDPLDIRVPGDFSSAFFLLAFGALAGPVRVRDVGLNPGRTGALTVLRRMGAESDANTDTLSAGEPVGQVTVRPSELRGTHVAAEEVPALIDEVPMLAVLAARAHGETRFDGVGELRLKESDRIAAISDNLRAIGVPTETGPDHLVVQGVEGPLSGTIDARGDHRIAMAFGVLGAVGGNAIDVRGGDVVAISFPDFWERLETLNKELHAQ